MAQSILANIAQRTNTAAAQAPSSDSVRTGLNFSGQYLYDRFIANDDAEVTKMGIVRQMADSLPIGEIKKVLKDFVAVAKEKGEAQEKTARNHMSVMRAACGALKHAKDELIKAGYNERTGYQTMRVLAKKALDAKGIKWDGSKVLSDEERDEKKHSAESKKALEEIQMENPQKIGESIKDWLDRIGEMVDQRTEELRAEARNKRITKMAQRVIELCGDDIYDIIARVDELMREEGEAQQGEGNEQTSEETEEVHA